MIDPKYLKIEYFEAQPTGGKLTEHKHAVRITHTPTGIVVSSDTEGTKKLNRKEALRELRIKLVEGSYEDLTSKDFWEHSLPEYEDALLLENVPVFIRLERVSKETSEVLLGEGFILPGYWHTCQYIRDASLKWDKDREVGFDFQSFRSDELFKYTRNCTYYDPWFSDKEHQLHISNGDDEIFRIVSWCRIYEFVRER